MALPLCAITMGDPAGIGPEILIKSAADDAVRAQADLIAVADLKVLDRAARVTSAPIELVPIKEITREAIEKLSVRQLAVYDLGGVAADTLEYGTVKAEYGRAAYDCITKAIDFALDDRVDAVVTNPINKEALNAAGVPHAGHTEIFAAQTGTKDYAMMLVHDPLRVVHVSTHVSLREACDMATKERVEKVVRLTADAIRRLDGTDGVVAVAGLNPHAGEHGLFGKEELHEIIPAIKQAQADGFNVAGPIPPDTVFSRAMGGEFSAVVVMYHDQGHIPLKLVGFQVDPATGKFRDVSGVNITLGLPIVRTSVDHGTAFDLAGKGQASHASLNQAIDYAVRLSRVR